MFLQTLTVVVYFNGLPNKLKGKWVSVWAHERFFQTVAKLKNSKHNKQKVIFNLKCFLVMSFLVT